MSSHVGPDGKPRMVDVGAKSPSVRRAVAEGLVTIPVRLSDPEGGEEWWTAKGPVFQTAVVAGIQGAKATATTVPLCHPLPLTSCDVSVERVRAEEQPMSGGESESSLKAGSTVLRVRCTVETTARTGVEMEALCGVSAACLTIYDMGKSVTHGIRIGPIELVEKRGGRRDWHREDA